MPKSPSFSIADLVTLARKRVDQSVIVATHAETRAADSNVDDAVSIIMGIEQLLYEANTLVNAASLINRITNEATRQD